jgi:hypothetical protein
LTKKAQSDVDKKKKKEKKRQPRTPYLRQPAAKSPHTKAQRRRVCVSTTVLGNQKKSRSSFKRKEVQKKIILKQPLRHYKFVQIVKNNLKIFNRPVKSLFLKKND